MVHTRQSIETSGSTESLWDSSGTLRIEAPSVALWILAIRVLSTFCIGK